MFSCIQSNWYVIELYIHDCCNMMTFSFCVFMATAAKRGGDEVDRRDNLILLSAFSPTATSIAPSPLILFLSCCTYPFWIAIERWSVFIHNSDLDETCDLRCRWYAGCNYVRMFTFHWSRSTTLCYLLLLLLLLYHWARALRMRCELNYNHPFILQNNVKCVCCVNYFRT